MLNVFRWIRVFRSRISKGYVRVDLNYLLTGANPEHSLLERVEWLDDLVEWIRLPVSPDDDSKNDQIQAARIKFLLSFLDRYPDLKKKVSATLQSILLEVDYTDFFAEAGIELQQGFVKEFNDRLVSNLIPNYRNPESLKQTFEKFFTSEDDIEWLRTLDPETIQRITALMTTTPEARQQILLKTHNALLSSLNLLAARLFNLSADPEMRLRLPIKTVFESPFYLLMSQFVSGNNNDFLPLISKCRAHIDSVYPLLEVSGVSVDLVYKLDTAKSYLRRIEKLIRLSQYVHAEMAPQNEMVSFIVRVADLHLQRSSLISFIGSNVNLIARKIVERTSETGEHYITRTAAEYREMFISACGGGLVTVFTTYIKTLIGKLSAPLFVEGFLTGLNYSVSFVGIQLMHFTLATKTPAMTASTLAGKLKNLNSESDANEFVDDVVCIVRSAFIAVLGNIGFVIPGVIIFELVYVKLTGHHLFAEEYAIKQFKAHNPFTSLTLLYGLLTGCILWFSSIMGGWIENWFVYRQQIEIFEESPRVNKVLGDTLQIRVADFFRRNLSGIASNSSLGFMLAFTGIWGSFFGLPLEVRHVTLSTATLTFSMMGISTEHLQEHLLLIAGSGFGILCIGILNFSVSFTLSLFVAARARNVKLSEFPHIIKLIVKRFFETPRKFFLP